MNTLPKLFPLLKDLKSYSKATFKMDAIAGLTVGVMFIPQAMAYAVLAGLPPIYGLYGGLLPLFLYAIFGTSKQLSIGPVAVSSILVAEGLSRIAEPLSAEFIGLAITAGLLIGLLQLLFSVLRMGFLVNFLAHPVVSGFTSAAAIIIIVSQLKGALGFEIPRFYHLHETISYAVQHLGETNWGAVCMCLGAIVVMVALKRWNPLIPGALVVVILGTLFSYLLNLSAYGLEIIGSVPRGLPAFQVPSLDFATLERIYPTVLTVTIIGIVESIGIAKSLEAKHQSYIVLPNQELMAIGLSKIGGAFFQSMPTSASFSRSAINNNAGARTTVASIVTVVVVMLTLLFFTPIFYYLPKAVLAAIILLAVRNLIDYKTALELWRTHKRDFVLLAVTFAATLAFGIDNGVLTGVVLSILNVLYHSSRPHVAVLGNIPNTTYYRNVERFDKVELLPNSLIVRFDNQLYFANASFFKDQIKMLLMESNQEIRVMFLDAKTIYDIDSSGLAALRSIHQLLKKEAIEFYICGAIGNVRDYMKKTGFTGEVGEEHCHLYLHDGIEHWRERH